MEVARGLPDRTSGLPKSRGPNRAADGRPGVQPVQAGRRLSREEDVPGGFIGQSTRGQPRNTTRDRYRRFGRRNVLRRVAVGACIADLYGSELAQRTLPVHLGQGNTTACRERAVHEERRPIHWEECRHRERRRCDTHAVLGHGIADTCQARVLIAVEIQSA